MTPEAIAWRLTEPPIHEGDAVEVALGLEVAKLGYGLLESSSQGPARRAAELASR